jgi:hypothetical protein
MAKRTKKPEEKPIITDTDAPPRPSVLPCAHGLGLRVEPAVWGYCVSQAVQDKRECLRFDTKPWETAGIMVEAYKRDLTRTVLEIATVHYCYLHHRASITAGKASSYTSAGQPLDRPMRELWVALAGREPQQPTRATFPEPRIEIVCTDCGSTDVRRDATAAWNTETQEWELCAVQDQGYCEKCEGEAKLEEKPMC